MSGSGRIVFPDYEAREEAFRRRVTGLIPRRHAGAQVFWRDFREVTRRGIERALARPVAHIPSNPRDCLAFGTPRQVLTAALMTAAGRPVAAGEADRLARCYRTRENLDQPVRTLSGGETVKVAMAKAEALLPTVTGLVMASPFSWLSRDNHPLLDRLIERCAQTGVPAELLLLEGEDDPHAAAPVALPPGPDFDLTLEGVSTRLSPALGGVGAVSARAAISDCRLRLGSPCLLTGANGQGKSLAARVLAGAVAYRGRVAIGRAAGPGRARLLFQDVMTQTLLRSRKAIAASAGARASEAWNLAADLYAEAVCPGTEPATPAPDAGSSLLALKCLLAAVRLAARPDLLILDEPDWGMRRSEAIAFVQRVIVAAHRQETALMLISHKPWWPSLAASRVAVSRRPGAPAAGGPALHIRMEALR